MGPTFVLTRDCLEAGLNCLKRKCLVRDHRRVASYDCSGAGK